MDGDTVQIRDDKVEDFVNSSMSENREFLYNLVQFTKPRRVLELGVYYGVSFFSYCEAVLDAKLKTELIGIDTWKGDEHANFYDDRVYRQFLELMNKYFSTLNTRLLRGTFDQYRGAIEDESVDIIMIDGTHTYESVKRDFLNYLPKLKRNGIVLFHDTNVDKFGVKYVWSELAAQYPHYNFKNEYGLGVLFPKGDLNYKRALDKKLFIKSIPRGLGNKKVAVYTCIYGDYDNLKPQVEQTVDCDFICYTDQEWPNRKFGWHIVRNKLENVNSYMPNQTQRLRSRYFKILPWKGILGNYDYTIYIDGQATILRPGFVKWALSKVKDKGLAQFKHPNRDCLFDEYNFCMQRGKFEGNDPRIDQIQRFEKAGMPKHWGLWAATVIFRDMRDKKVEALSNLWWKELGRGVCRDQISLPYVFWKFGYKPETIDLDLYDNSYIYYGKHK